MSIISSNFAPSNEPYCFNSKLSQIMRKKFLVALVLGALLTMPNMLCAEAKAHKSPNELALSPSKSLVVVGNKNTEVLLSQDPQGRLSIEGCSVKDLKIATSDSMLFVSAIGVDSIIPLRLHISMPLYEQLHCSFVKMISGKEVIFGNDISITAIDADVNMNIEANLLQMILLGGKSAFISGMCKSADITCKEYDHGEECSFDASQLTAQNMRLHCGVKTNIHINVSDSLWLKDGIETKVMVQGMPTIIENKLFRSEVTLQNR